MNEDLKSYFKDMVSKRALQNCMFTGCAGMGKTTLARILCNEFNAEVLFVKCATEGTIDVLRSKIEPFCNSMSIEGKVKIVILDELDSSSASGANNFQLGLRTLIEAAQDDTRFIATCNYVSKVIPAVISRCPIVPLKYEKHDLLVHLKKILDKENVKYDKDSLKAFIEENFSLYPDCRHIINNLQFCCNSGELKVKMGNIVNSDRAAFLDELLKKIRETSKVMEIREFYFANKSKIDDYKTFGAQLFEHLLDNKIIDDPRCILKMSDIIYQMNLVVNPEIQFFALVCLVQAVLHK